jgi:hypothetical protein
MKMQRSEEVSHNCIYMSDVFLRVRFPWRNIATQQHRRLGWLKRMVWAAVMALDGLKQSLYALMVDACSVAPGLGLVGLDVFI